MHPLHKLYLTLWAIENMFLFVVVRTDSGGFQYQAHNVIIVINIFCF
jgi:hypothetical protein